MAIDTPDFITLQAVKDKTRYMEQRWIDRDMPLEIIERSIELKFHFPVSQAYVIRHFALDGEPFAYNRDDVSFYWLVRNMWSEYVPDPDHPKEKKLVGVIDAIVVTVPDDTTFPLARVS